MRFPINRRNNLCLERISSGQTCGFWHLIRPMQTSTFMASISRAFARLISQPKSMLIGLITAVSASAACAQSGGTESGAGASSGPSAPASAVSSTSANASAPAIGERKWLKVPRVIGHLGVKDLGIIINDDDPYSVQVGVYYAKARRIPEDQILRVSLPVKASLTPSEFDALVKKIDAFFGDRVQALALAWRLPYGVDCNAITGALAMGFDAKLCSSTCSPSRQSAYFGSASNKPWTDHHMRLSMLLAARDVDGAKAMIDRGVRSDNSLGLRGAPPVGVHFVTTADSVRSQRQVFFPPAGAIPKAGIDVHLDKTEALRNVKRVLIYMTGRANVDGLDTVGFVPGALADHLTSFGGMLDQSFGQMSVLSWIEAGATASYGTTSEPCAHLQKFPNPQALLQFYVQGATALEAYWKSVVWPQQGLFVGEPLAAPFARN
jgi:uncharacterized protein (TIGR03790 family)